MSDKRPLVVLELFAGTRSIGKAFEAKGHKVYSVDWDKSFTDIDLYADIGKLTIDDINNLVEGQHIDVVWLSPDCTSYSLAAIGKHRKKNPTTGNLDPQTEYAKFCDNVNAHCIDLLKEINPSLYFIENPRGGFRKMTFMQGLPRYTVTYCKYTTDLPLEQRRMKPTDIWTNHPDPKFIPPCTYGDPCHVAAPRGSKTGTQGLKDWKERSKIPEALCKHVVDISEEYIYNNDKEDKPLISNREQLDLFTMLED